MNEVVLTSDDSSSIYSQKFDALYHSKHGAIQEGLHVFINAGYKHFLNNSLRKKNKNSVVKILETGFGSGLNALLTLIETEKTNTLVKYQTIEAYPLQSPLLSQLNYTDILGYVEEFNLIHTVKWEDYVGINDLFKIKKRNCLFEEFFSDEKFDVIYYDAFAPNTQKELWSIDMMKKMHSLSKIGSILVTYCAKGVVRRTMEEAGFEVSRIPGPPGKREMLRAVRVS